MGLAALLVPPAELHATDLAPPADIVISEISYNPPATLGDDTAFEFVELANRGNGAIDLSGWRLTDRDAARVFVLPAGATIAAGGHLVLSRNAAALAARYGDGLAVIGDFEHPLGNDGDTVRLFDADGALIDEVVYDDDAPWPILADGRGATLERVDLGRELTDFAHFRASAPGALPGTPGRANSVSGPIDPRVDIVINEIMYNPVKRGGVDPLQHCLEEEFVELYNRGSAGVELAGWSFVEGIAFTFPAGSAIPPGEYVVVFRDEAAFRAKYGGLPERAFGPYEFELDDGGERLVLADDRGEPIDFVDYNDRIPWPINADGISGSLELIDPWSDNDRARAWDESEHFGGSPGAENSASVPVGPQLTRLRARPATDPARASIRSDDVVRIRTRAVDRDGVAGVALLYQICVAGDYIRLTDRRFETDWERVEMRYDPETALWIADIAARPHRSLVRYRVEATDELGATSVAPRAADPEPNLAYFVYDGIPDYVASRRSAFGTPGVVHRDLDTVPVYFMIGAERDIEEAQYRGFPIDSVYRWRVTIVHDDRVYDHCRMRLRTGHRYTWPKRPWKIRFNKGNYFHGHYDDGRPFERPRSRINLATAQHDPTKIRGEGGVVESLAFKTFGDAGVLTASTNFVHLRVVRSTEEHDQFLGDFFGLYVDIQRIDTIALAEQDRPNDDDSEIYKFNGAPVKKHPDCDPSLDHVLAFMEGHRPQPAAWYEARMDLDRYFSFRSVVELIDGHDMDSLKNFMYYFDGEAGLWEVVPWDLDNTFGSTASGDEPFNGRVLPLFRTPYRNRLRFVWQTVYDEKRMLRQIDEWSAIMGHVADADQDRWDTEPRQACPNWPNTSGTNCEAYLPFRIRMRNLRQWIRARRLIARNFFRDTRIPETPENVSPPAGGATAKPVTLRASAYSDPNGLAHAATRWLVIARGGDWAFPRFDQTTGADESLELPAEVTTVGGEFLFRVMYGNEEERWGFLSEPTAFVVGEPDASPPGAPGELIATSVRARAVTLSWSASADPHSDVHGYRVSRDGSPLTTPAGALFVRGTGFVDFTPSPGATHAYAVTAVNGAGLESEPSTALRVEIPEAVSIGPWKSPPSGLDYLYDALPGHDLYTSRKSLDDRGALDGTWARAGSDDWDGSEPGEAITAPGGASIQAVLHDDDIAPLSVLTLEDPGNPRFDLPPPNNSRLYFLRMADERRNLLDEGITLAARLRVSPEPVDLDEPRGQQPERSKLRGQIGAAARFGATRRSISIWLADGALHLPGDRVLPLETTRFHDVWMTIAADPASEGALHRVRLWLNGDTEPAFDEIMELPDVGTESRVEGTYLQMGLDNEDESGAIQIDYFGFVRGDHPPRRAGAPDTFVRGDATGDGDVALDDAVRILEHLFAGTAMIACPDAADTDDSGRVDITDAIALLDHRFRAAPPPPEPFPECGEDPTEDALEACDPPEACR